MPEETRIEKIKKAIEGLKSQGIPEEITKELEEWLAKEISNEMEMP